MQKRILSMLVCLAMLVTLSLSGAVLPVSAEEAVNLLKGGDFEAPAGDAVYNTNWTSDILKSTSAGPAACTIVTDTAGETAGNQCLEIPLYTEKQYIKYFKNVSLQPDTSYTLTMDVRGSKAQVYVSGDGIASGKGTKTIGGTEEWVRYSFTIVTNSDTAKLANFKNWGISFIRNPASAATIEGVTYVDNIKLRLLLRQKQAF